MTNILEQIAFRVNAAQVAALTCSLLLDPPYTEERIAHAKREAEKAKAVAGNALAMLQEESARVDAEARTHHAPTALLDTSANRALLQALDAAMEAAEIVNAERRSVVPDSFPIKRLHELRDRVLLELQGADNAKAKR